MSLRFIKSFSIIIVLMIGGVIKAQEQSAIEKEVNQQVWQVFKTSYQERDSEAFKAIHTKDVLRVHDGGVRLAGQYFEGIANWRPFRQGRSIEIDFAFESRNYKDTVGYEVGYYRVLSSQVGMETSASYGMFHVVLKKDDGQWKIAQDFDTGKVGQVKIDASFFNQAEFLPLQ